MSVVFQRKPLLLFILLSSFYSFFSFADKKDINVEIREVEESLRTLDPRQPGLPLLSAYLAWLKNQQSKAVTTQAATAQTVTTQDTTTQAATTQDTTTEDATKCKDSSDMECDDLPEEAVLINAQLRNRIQEVDLAVQGQLQIGDILDLFQEIDDRIDRYQFGIFLKRVRLNHGSIGSPVKVEIKEPDEVFIDFGNNKLGEGEYKIVKGAFTYRTWSQFSKLKSRAWVEGKIRRGLGRDHRGGSVRQLWVDPRNAWAYGSLTYELPFLRLISGLPKENRGGLVRVYHIANDDTVVQKLYSFNLIELLLKSNRAAKEQDLTYGQKLEIYRQLTEGLVNLHRFDIAHNDVKLENALIKKKTVEGVPVFKAAYGDFGLSKQYQDPALETVVNGGSPKYASPDRVERMGWIGTTSEQKMQNVLKTDVFSHAVVGFMLFREEGLPLNENNFFLVTQYLNKMRKNPESYSSLLHLILKGMEPDPSDRPSAEKFLEAVKYLQEKERIRPHANGCLRFEVPAAERQLSVGKFFQATEKIIHIPGFMPYGNENDIEKRKKILEKSPPGTYVITQRHSRISNVDYFGVGVYFKGPYGVREIQLDTDLDTAQIKNEIEFLKSLGDLTEPLKPS